VTFTATVSAAAPGSGTPTGSVTFYDGTTKLGTGTLNGGSAAFTITTLSIGTHSITAVYGGDGNFKTSTSPALSQVVQSAAAVALMATTGSTLATTSSTVAAMGSTATTATGSAPTVTSMAIAAAPAVDLAIAALQDDPATGSSVHDLALDQVSTKARRWSVDPSE
jgi:hypothetical protein